MSADRATISVLFGAALAFAAPAAAQETRLSLPLTAPEGAHELVADFVEICSKALVDQGAALAEARERGWVDMSGETEMERAFLQAGNFTATQGLEGEPSVFLMSDRQVFAHLELTNCGLQTLGAAGRPEGFDPAVLSRIDGVAAGEAPFAALDPAAGLWSFVDETGEVVTIASIPVDGENLTITMSRAERTGP